MQIMQINYTVDHVDLVDHVYNVDLIDNLQTMWIICPHFDPVDHEDTCLSSEDHTLQNVDPVYLENLVDHLHYVQQIHQIVTMS